MTTTSILWNTTTQQVSPSLITEEAKDLPTSEPAIYKCLCAQPSFVSYYLCSLFNNRRARVHAAPGGLPAAPRDPGQPRRSRAPSTGQVGLTTRQWQRGRGHLPDAHRVLLPHLHLPASVQPTSTCQLLLPHSAGDAELLR